jgi:hypothetical protein
MIFLKKTDIANSMGGLEVEIFSRIDEENNKSTVKRYPSCFRKHKTKFLTQERMRNSVGKGLTIEVINWSTKSS